MVLACTGIAYPEAPLKHVNAHTHTHTPHTRQVNEGKLANPKRRPLPVCLVMSLLMKMMRLRLVRHAVAKDAL